MSNTTTNTNENNVSNEDIQKSVSSVNLTNNGFFIGVAIFYISMISYYFLVKEIINDDNKTLYYKILAGYTLIISTILFFINYTTVYNKCGESQLGTAFLSTYLPWIIIFGSISDLTAESYRLFVIILLTTTSFLFNLRILSFTK